MSHDAHSPADAGTAGPGIEDTLSGWTKPDGAESSTTVVKMVSDTIGKTVKASRALLALPIVGTASLVTGAVTVGNKLTLGAAYTGVNAAARIMHEANGKVYQLLSGNKA